MLLHAWCMMVQVAARPAVWSLVTPRQALAYPQAPKTSHGVW
jgi:hypothetical protein